MSAVFSDIDYDESMFSRFDREHWKEISTGTGSRYSWLSAELMAFLRKVLPHCDKTERSKFYSIYPIECVFIWNVCFHWSKEDSIEEVFGN